MYICFKALDFFKELFEDTARASGEYKFNIDICRRMPNAERFYEASCTWNRRIRACTDSHCTSLYLVYLPARIGSLITTRLPLRSRRASRPVLLLLRIAAVAIGGVGILAIFVPLDKFSDVKRLSALLTTPLHSRGHTLCAARWCLCCSHLSAVASAAVNG